MNKIRPIVCFAVTMLATGAFAADATWKNEVTDGDWNSADSWQNGTLPASGNTANINNTSGNALTVRLSQDSDPFKKLCLKGTNQTYFDVLFELAPYTLLGANGTWGDSFFVQGYARARQVSGVVSNVCALVLEENSSFTIDGAGTKFIATRDNTCFSKGTNITFSVTGGAFFQSGRETRVGNDNVCSNTLISVSGPGSVYLDRSEGNYTQFPKQGTHNHVLVEDGGSYSNNHPTASGQVAIGSGAACNYNDFIVDNGHFYSRGPVNVGAGGSWNWLNITNGSTAVFNNGIYVGVNSNANCNVMTVGGGSVVSCPSHIGIGRRGTYSNALYVAGSGTVVSNTTYDTLIGRGGRAAKLVVSDGAELYANRRFMVGGPDNPDGFAVVDSNDNLAIFEGAGTMATVGNHFDARVAVGYYGTNNVMIVRDGAKFVKKDSNQFYVGGSATAFSNRLEIAGANTVFSNQVAGFYVGADGSSGNEVRVKEAKAVSFKKMHIGAGDGSCSNVVYVTDGAVVSNSYATLIGTGTVNNPESVVGNGLVISNATYVSSTEADEMVVNQKGVGGFVRVLGGGKLKVHQSCPVGGQVNTTVWTGCHDGLIEVDGEGSSLYQTVYHMGIGRQGYSNTLRLTNGGCYTCSGSMNIGNSALAGTTNNCLYVYNGGFTNTSSEQLHVWHDNRIVWGGSRSQVRITSLTYHNGGELDFVFDEHGIAPLKTLYETYLVDANFKPTIGRIKVDATKFVKAGVGGTFTLLASGDKRTCRVVGTTSDSVANSVRLQTPEKQAEINQAFADLIEVEPAAALKSVSVDMAKSTIEITLRKMKGFVFIVR